MLNVYDLKIAHPDIFRQLAVKDNLFVYYKCPQSERLVKLFNHYNAIYFTLSGRKAFHYKNKSWHLTEDDSLVVCRGAYCQEMFKDLDWEVLGFHFNDDFAKRVFQDYSKNFPRRNITNKPLDPILSVKINERIKASYYALLSFFTNGADYSEYLLELKIKELMLHVLTEPKNHDIRAYFNQINNRDRNPLWQVMEQNFMFNLSLSDFAQLSQRSVTSFKNEFKKVYKTTPGKWLLNKRLDKAEKELVNSTKNISEIAFDNGFENVSHFSRVFKIKFGKSPLQYRKTQIIYKILPY